MSSFIGPNKITDNLFFAYDAANLSKCNTGKPVENLLRSENNTLNIYHPDRRPATGVPTSLPHGSYAVSTEVQPPVPGATVYRVDDNGVDSQNARWSIRLNANTFLTYDQEYTFSSWVYLPSQYAGRYTGSSIEIYQNSTGTDWHSFRGFQSTFNYYGAGSIETDSVSPDVSLLDEWQRMAVTFTPLSANINLPENNGNDNNIWAAGFFRINVSNAVNDTGFPYHLYISDAQLETGNILSRFTLSERLNSASLLDMTGRIAITTSNLAYSSDSVFKFNGTSSYLDISDSQWGALFNQATGTDFTIDLWLKPENIGTNQALFSQQHGTGLSMYLMDNGKVTLEMDDTNTRVGTNTTLANNTWYNITVVFNNSGDASTCDYYVNGLYERSEAKWDGTGIGNQNLCYIGWQSRTNYSINPGYFQGEIPIVSVYNRALSNNEVYTNFNGNRSRFSL